MTEHTHMRAHAHTHTHTYWNPRCMCVVSKSLGTHKKIQSGGKSKETLFCRMERFSLLGREFRDSLSELEVIFFFNFIGVQLLYDAVLLSAVQQSESAMYTYTHSPSSFFGISSHLSHQRA